MFRTLAAAALLVTTTALSATSAGAAEKPETTPAQRVNALVSPSIVYLETVWTARIGNEDDNTWVNPKGKPFTLVSRCTGFVLTGDGYLGTAAHCITPKDDAVGINMREAMINEGVAYAKSTWCSTCATSDLKSYADRYFSLYPVTSDGNRKDRIRYPTRTVKASWGANVSGIETDEARPAKVMASQTFNNGDTALLKVNEDGMNALPVPRNGEDVATGLDISAVGYPAAVDEAVDADYTPSIKNGTVSSVKEHGGGLTDVYELDADVYPGMSGGPTVTDAGEVIGVNSFGPGSERRIAFAQPIENLQELTRGEGVALKLDPITKKYRAGIEAYFEGDKKTAVNNLQDVVDEQPANGIAKEYLEKAKDLPNPPPPEDKGISTTLLLILGGGLLLLALLGGLAFMLLRRRSGPDPMPQGPAFAPPPGGETGAPPAGGYPQPQTQPMAPVETKVPSPRTPDEAGAPTGHVPTEPTEVRSPAPAGFAPTSNAQGGPNAPRSTLSPASQPGVTTSASPTMGPAVTSVNQPAVAGEHHFCTECGAKVPPGGKFCGECGHPV